MHAGMNPSLATHAMHGMHCALWFRIERSLCVSLGRHTLFACVLLCLVHHCGRCGSQVKNGCSDAIRASSRMQCSLFFIFRACCCLLEVSHQTPCANVSNLFPPPLPQSLPPLPLPLPLPKKKKRLMPPHHMLTNGKTPAELILLTPLTLIF